MNMSTEIIDAYAHCGLSKYRPIEEVRQIMARFGVARAVLVQHMGEYDNSYIGAIVKAEPEEFVGVMLVDTEGEAVESQMDHWIERYPFRGIRLIAHTLDTHRQIWESAVRRGLNIIVYEDMGITPYAGELARFAGEHANSRLVISHLSVLRGVHAADLASYDSIRQLADEPNVYVQVSGMHMFAEPPYRSIVPLIERLVDSIGPERMLYGSNFPVMGLDAVYGLELDLLCDGRLGVPVDAVRQVAGQTARSLWFN